MKEWYIGCDLGGTNLRAALVNVTNGSVRHAISTPTLSREGPNAVIQRMIDLFHRIIKESGISLDDIGGIGIGVPGTVDMERGIVLFLPNLPTTWPNIPLAEYIQKGTTLPTVILNDVRAITFGEWRFGAGQGVDTMACFAIGTGIGGGLVINRQLHLGFGGTAGELGHITVDVNGPRCGCGNYGCVEVFASGPAIAAMGMKAVVQGWTTQIGSLVDYDLNRITPEIIARAARNGDAVAREIFEIAGGYIGTAVANVVVAINPQRVVIAGGVAQAGDLLLDPIRRTLHKRVFVAPKERVEIVPSVLGNNAGVIGAALWAYHNHENS
ncbi:ROK family protein [Thermanaerothrix sp. 4228-RoL]|jgi:glucokinase|uniref:ROK family protein n=1 Tax=Thermanaerothrix solaris TaxID=3058434 RepID=A0ABU3NMX4_9CHLR|nr:ROK family protein [Thermanaerothrix sp. 4228-RoL]MDT8897186.1 ROK family protein [Thermanaerothrix sp. 4228-RoL]